MGYCYKRFAPALRSASSSAWQQWDCALQSWNHCIEVVAMRLTYIAATALIASLTATASWAADPAPATPAAHFNTASTSIGDLLDNPAAHAILQKYLPEIANGDERARPMTLKALQGYAPDMVSDAVLAKIDAELAALPAGK
jgi:hypothetical protein